MGQRVAEIDIVLRSQKAEASLSRLEKGATRLETRLGKVSGGEFNSVATGANRAKTSIDRMAGSSAALGKVGTSAKAANDHLRLVETSARRANAQIAKTPRKPIDDLSGSTQTLYNRFLNLKNLIAGGIVFSLGKNLFDVARETDNYNAILKTATGSMDLAKQKFAELNAFARRTPFTLKDTVEGFVKLKNLGLEPTERALTSFGNTSAAMGKSLNQFIEAVADATTNEFERLKEFGIKSRKEGENVTFTFQGIETTVRASATAIQGYLVGLGETKFSQAMVDQMDTLNGKLSNLRQSFDDLLRNIGGSGVFKTAIDATATVLKGLSDNLDLIGLGAGVLATVLTVRLGVALIGVTAQKALAIQQSLLYQVALARMAGATGLAAGATGLLRGALALVGGPLGAALLAGAGIYYYRDSLIFGERKTGDMAKAQKGLKDALDITRQVTSATAKEGYENVKSLDEQTRATRDLIRAQAQSKIDETTAKIADLRDKLGVKAGERKKVSLIGAIFGSEEGKQAIALENAQRQLGVYKQSLIEITKADDKLALARRENAISLGVSTSC